MKSIAYLFLVFLSVTMFPSCIHQPPPAPTGAMSVIHQNILTTATEEALNKANLGEIFQNNKGEKFYLEFSGQSEQTDPGRSFVKNLIQKKMSDIGFNVVDSEGKAQRKILINFKTVGVDVSLSDYIILSISKANAVVDLDISIYKLASKEIVSNLSGRGDAQYTQTYILGFIGPTESFK